MDKKNNSEAKEVERIAEDARNSLGNFCFEECGAYCCRKGYLLLTASQVKLFSEKAGKELGEIRQLKKINDDKFSMYMGEKDKPCPNLDLKELKCRIHKHPNKPSACSDFPIFVDHETRSVKLSSRCLAVRKNMFYGHEKEIVMKKYRIVKSDPMAEAEFYVNQKI